ESKLVTLDGYVSGLVTTGLQQHPDDQQCFAEHLEPKSLGHPQLGPTMPITINSPSQTPGNITVKPQASANLFFTLNLIKG
ncbi:Hypothetical predicted protein, partial [Marmota monax]